MKEALEIKINTMCSLTSLRSKNMSKGSILMRSFTNLQKVGVKTETVTLLFITISNT